MYCMYVQCSIALALQPLECPSSILISYYTEYIFTLSTTTAFILKSPATTTIEYSFPVHHSKISNVARWNVANQKKVTKNTLDAWFWGKWDMKNYQIQKVSFCYCHSLHMSRFHYWPLVRSPSRAHPWGADTVAAGDIDMLLQLDYS